MIIFIHIERDCENGNNSAAVSRLDCFDMVVYKIHIHFEKKISGTEY